MRIVKTLVLPKNIRRTYFTYTKEIAFTIGCIGIIIFGTWPGILLCDIIGGLGLVLFAYGTVKTLNHFNIFSTIINDKAIPKKDKKLLSLLLEAKHARLSCPKNIAPGIARGTLGIYKHAKKMSLDRYTVCTDAVPKYKLIDITYDDKANALVYQSVSKPGEALLKLASYIAKRQEAILMVKKIKVKPWLAKAKCETTAGTKTIVCSVKQPPEELRNNPNIILLDSIEK